MILELLSGGGSSDAKQVHGSLPVVPEAIKFKFCFEKFCLLCRMELVPELSLQLTRCDTRVPRSGFITEFYFSNRIGDANEKL